MNARVWKATRVRTGGLVAKSWGWQAAIYERRRRRDGNRIWFRAADGGPVHLDEHSTSTRSVDRVMNQAQYDAELDGAKLGLPHRPDVKHNGCAIELEDFLPVEVCAEWRLDVGLQLAIFYRGTQAKQRRCLLGRRRKGDPADEWTVAAELGSWRNVRPLVEALSLPGMLAKSLPRTVGAVIPTHSPKPRLKASPRRRR